ncbi:hypothetical protein SAY86_009177 [Trapa natans]|uniref:Uncharacterized protein n=1 Tax=Trapa natans TaxID=22666 RepID=A0AAN7KE48_TRANT|nr:hypothetical protein SAY86_009177 [Trapa natans]
MECLHDTTISYHGGNEECEMEEEKTEIVPVEDLGEQTASALLGEIEQGGVVDSMHQGLLFLLCAACPPDVSKVRVGKLSPYGIGTPINIRDFLGVAILKCVGCRMKNLSKKVSWLQHGGPSQLL